MESKSDLTGYFALTKNEINKGEIRYPKHSKYTHKAIHKNLMGLRDFIENNFGSTKDWYYVQVDISKVKTDPLLDDNEVFNVRLPFSFSFSPNDVRLYFKETEK